MKEKCQSLYRVNKTVSHLEVLQWLRANGCPWILETYELAEAGEHYEAMAWMIQNGIQDLDGFFEAFTEDLD